METVSKLHPAIPGSIQEFPFDFQRLIGCQTFADSCDPRVILNQFLIEAMVVALIGGLIGIAVGVISSYAIAAIAGWRVALSPLTIVLAVGFAAAVGVFFGYYPARKASRLSPIEALRYE